MMIRREPIVAFPGYEISTEGVVYSTPRKIKCGNKQGFRQTKERILKPFINIENKPAVQLFVNGKRFVRTIEVLMGITFLFVKKVKHKNGDIMDNRLSNLEPVR